MELNKALKLVALVFADPLVSEKAKLGNENSSNQTDHGMAHLLEVVRLALIITNLYCEKYPGKLSDWERYVIIPLAALLHDIGRAIDVDNHAAAGAKWARDYLLTLTLPGETDTLPRPVINRICKIIACHRSGIVLKRDFDDACWAIVVLADKFAGDEERVRPFRAMVISMLTFFRLSCIPLRRGGVHDRANFAIKNVKIEMREDDLFLRLHVDPRVCKGRLILDLYSERYVACHRAAKYLGLNFRLETFEQATGKVANLLDHVGLQRKNALFRYAYDEVTTKWLSCN